MREELRVLRDRLEEEEWAKTRLEQKSREMEEEVASLKRSLEGEREGRMEATREDGIRNVER